MPDVRPDGGSSSKLVSTESVSTESVSMESVSVGFRAESAVYATIHEVSKSQYPGSSSFEGDIATLRAPTERFVTCHARS